MTEVCGSRRSQMPFDSKDPRSGLNSKPSGESKAASEFAGTEYLKFYEIAPDEKAGGAKTWYGRGQNFILAYTEASAGTELSRIAQPDEYVVLLPDPDMRVEISTAGGKESVPGNSISFVPPGNSSLHILNDGPLVRLFSVKSEDLLDKCSNAESFETPHPNVSLFEPWPDPPDGYRLRSYSLDVPEEEGRFGRIWRGSTFMVNYFYPAEGPRDPTKLSPHSHDDFEQCSLCLGGEFIHHIRWPWITNKNMWRDDEHELCGAPSIAVIPSRAIHTTEAVGKGINQLVDIFCPPRMDFSKKEGWVLNAEEYPIP